MSQPAFRAEIEKAIRKFEDGAKAKDANALASLYEENATLLPPGSPAIKGRQNIRDFWKAFLDAGAADPVVRPVHVDGSGELAYETGEYQVTLPNSQGGGTTRQDGKYLVVWRRQTDGTIKMAADMFSPNA